MAILNVTPDSFFSGSRFLPNQLADTVGEMIRDGANWLDIGGQSTRPGSERISEQEEADRVLPAIELIHSTFPESLISIDTYYSSVARNALKAGAGMINDVTAGSLDPEIYRVAAELQVPYVLMHMQGTLETMQKQHVYTDIIADLVYWFSERLTTLRLRGVHDVLIDPGFGFGKSTSHNYQLLARLGGLRFLDTPLLIGLSRKRMIQQAVGSDAQGALYGTLAAQTIALMNGASVLRVHDVKAASDAIKVWEQTIKAA